MKSIFTILLAVGIFYLSSCTTSTNNVVIPKADSLSNKGSLQIAFNGESFSITNLTVLNSPVYTSSGTMIPTDITDTLFIGQFQMTDHKDKTVSLNLTGHNNTSGAAIGTYMITTNSSTLIDYSQGENRTYGVGIGSYITVTNIIADTTFGTLNLNLFYNNNTYPATGTFQITN